MSEASKVYYQKHLKPEAYRDLTLSMATDLLHTEFEFLFKSAMDFFNDPKYQGETLLDLATGPSPFPVYPAIHQFSEFTLSEFTDACREHLRKLTYKEPVDADWAPVNRIAAKWLGYSDLEAGRFEIEDIISKKVKDVIPCDFLSDHILPVNCVKQYDAVSSSFALESVPFTLQEFHEVLRKIGDLVKEGGFLVLRGILECSSWMCGGVVFPNYSISPENMETGLAKAGFVDIVWKTMPKQDEFHVDFSKAFCLVCVKKQHDSKHRTL